MPSPPLPRPINHNPTLSQPQPPFRFPSTSTSTSTSASPNRNLNSVSVPTSRAHSPTAPTTTNTTNTLAPSPTIRRKSFNVTTTTLFPDNQPRTRTKTAPSPIPKMMTTMNMAHRLAGGRVKDQTVHYSISDRSSTHTKPLPAQDNKLGYSADGLKRISNGLGNTVAEGKVAPCAWEPIAIPIMRLEEPKGGWASAQAFFREKLSEKLDVYVRDVRIREPNDDFQHEYELIRTAAEKAGKSDINEATIAHAEALAHTASLASLEGNLLALIRIWSELDEEMEGWIRSEMALLTEEFQDRQLCPKKYKKMKKDRKKALKKQMFLDRKAENAKKKLELKELKRKLQEEQLEREKNGIVAKKEFGPDAFWPLEKPEDLKKVEKAPSSHGSQSGSDDDLYTDAEDETEEDEPENDEEREERRIDAEKKERRLARKAKRAEEQAAQIAAAAAAGESIVPEIPKSQMVEKRRSALMARLNRSPSPERIYIKVNSVPPGSDINFPNAYPPGWHATTEPVPELDPSDGGPETNDREPNAQPEDRTRIPVATAPFDSSSTLSNSHPPGFAPFRPVPGLEPSPELE